MWGGARWRRRREVEKEEAGEEERVGRQDKTISLCCSSPHYLMYSLLSPPTILQCSHLSALQPPSLEPCNAGCPALPQQNGDPCHLLALGSGGRCLPWHSSLWACKLPVYCMTVMVRHRVSPSGGQRLCTACAVRQAQLMPPLYNVCTIVLGALGAFQPLPCARNEWSAPGSALQSLMQ